MELKIEAIAIPEQVISFNYEELKTELLKKADFYSSLVYTDDQIKEAKSDRANLNRLKKALNDERLRREKEYMEPFNQFKAQIAEIIKIIDKPCSVIDTQIKAFEEQQKAEKLEAIRELVAETAFPVSLEKVMDDKWLNASTSLKSIKEALEAKKAQIMAEMKVIDDLPEFSFEAKDFYLKHLDLAGAMMEVDRLKIQAEAKARWEAQKAEAINQAQKAEAQSETVEADPVEAEPEPAEPVRRWIGFKALLSADEAKALGSFLKAKNIKYKAI